MEHEQPEQIDTSIIREQLEQQLHQLERNLPVTDATATAERARIRQRRAQAALDRLAAGIYGLCCQCGLSVEPEVLHIDPAAPFCDDCQSEVDLRRRHA